MSQTPVSALARRRQRQHVNRDDTPKRPFATKKVAEEFLKASGWHITAEAYQCGICKHWHIGHKPEEEEK